jgi:N-acetylmuramoyl-L-alanine amidase
MISSLNFDDRLSSTPIDMLVIHYTGMKSAKAALDRLCDPQAKVSAHYFIDEDGDIISLVDESKRAWHAGIASWRGESDINARSIGVELVNPGHDFGYRNFPESQMTALIDLLLEILSRHSIPARNVVGHSDIAPSRKTDPGERFDWAWLAAEGIGLWPHDADIGNDTSDITSMLSEYGYDITIPASAITAFQRHFYPETLNKIIDSKTIGRLMRLIELSNA